MTDNKYQGRFFVFHKDPKTAAGSKSELWAVTNASGATFAGVKWFEQYDDYCFYMMPRINTAFTYEHLEDIAAFCKQLSLERSKK